ncbi:hypothetical protein ES319_D10G276700v1 [Gossypium barbadense]|uniref:Uncharacterized protein n=1 Tax=Gossypium barbadense TaxID=3634 RepID=A0A5J5PZD1_GOSBA|nr:hypothetical protein ES319_D10G276700v1 [Gossypium barbadense]
MGFPERTGDDVTRQTRNWRLIGEQRQWRWRARIGAGAGQTACSALGFSC